MRRPLALILILCVLLAAATASAGGSVFQHGVKSLPVNERGEYQSSITNIDYAHNEIHEGKHYYWTNSSVLTTGQAVGLLFAVNATHDPHMDIRVIATGEGTFSIYEGVTNSSAGGFLTPRNRNRNYPDSSNHWLKSGASVLTSGTTIYSNVFGSGRSIGGEMRSENEIILRANTVYFFNATSTSIGNTIEVILDWYEEDED